MLLEGTAAESTAPIESEMKQSGSLDLDASVSAALPRDSERSATLPAGIPGAQAAQGLAEGTLSCKHNVESSGKKATNR